MLVILVEIVVLEDLLTLVLLAELIVTDHKSLRLVTIDFNKTEINSPTPKDR